MAHRQNLLAQLFPSSSSSRPSPSPSPLPPPGAVATPSMLDDVDDPDAGDEENVFRDMSFDEILEDLNARFLVNLPKEETSLVRVYWQAEQAHWFYEDYLRPLNPLLPSMSQRHFTHLIIASSPLYSHLSSDDYDTVWEEYCRYKRMVPCCGGILINAQGDKVLMVRGWKSNAGWCFPRGKINSEETEVSCAIREVEEETGFNLAGLINPKDKIQTQISAQTVTMFIVPGIDENTTFQTQTRKEIGAIEWVPFADLPTWTGKRGPKTTAGTGKKKFYNVTPFVGPLKRWMSEHGINPHPKRRPKPSAQDQTFRALEPYSFDAGSTAASPQPGPPTVSPFPTHEHRDNTSALDNLFHKFIHKQEEETVNEASPYGKENRAGLERLFGSIDILRQEDMATPATGHQPASTSHDQHHLEDDALAKLLGGLSATLAPRAETPSLSASKPNDKAAKLLSVLNTPNTTAPAPAPAPPAHQANLLAMLSPKQAAPVPIVPPQPAPNPFHHPQSLPQTSQPVSLPTPSRPDTVTPTPPASVGTAGAGIDATERAKRQRALLEQITAGLGADEPSFAQPPASSYAQSDDRSASQESTQRHVATRSSAVDYQRSMNAPQTPAGALPPPYDSINHTGGEHPYHPHPQSSLPQVHTASCRSSGSVEQAYGASHGYNGQKHHQSFSGNQQVQGFSANQPQHVQHPPTNGISLQGGNFDGHPPSGLSDGQQQNLLNILRKQPGKVNPQGPQGVPYGSISAGQASTGHRSPPQPILPNTMRGGQPPVPVPFAGYGQMTSQHHQQQLHVHPPPAGPYQPNRPLPQIQGPTTNPPFYPAQPPFPLPASQFTQYQTHPVTLPTLGYGERAPPPPPHLSGPTLPHAQKVESRSVGYHHPVPRPPNAQVGTLLGMLNEGR